jgi:Putative DNA-binding domain
MNLAALQRDFRSWLTVEASDAAARFGDRAEPGLAVYLNNYRGQLMVCLSESFATVRAWLGEDAFDTAAATHIDRQPPYSWTLDAYALEFPETIDALYPDDPEVGELARLERDLGLAFVGRDAAPLDLATLAHIDWNSSVLDLVATFSTLPATTNAGAIWSAINAGQTPPAAAVLDSPAVIAIWRREYSPTFRTLDPMESQVMSMVADGRTFGEICRVIVDEVGEAEGTQVAGNLLGRWIREGMVAAVRN